MNLQQFFRKEGYDITDKLNWDKYIEIWDTWYKGKVKKFHNYYIYNGQTRVKMEKKSLQGAKKVSEDWADLLFNDKVLISLNDEEETKKFKEISQEMKLYMTVNQGIEKSFALGTGAFVTSVQNIKFSKDNNILDVTEAKTKTEFVDVKKIYPLTWNNREIIECAFVTTKYNKGQQYIYIAMHILNDLGNYVVKNHMFKGKYNSFAEVEDQEKEGFIEEFDTKNNIPWFSIITPNICNNIEDDTPFGLSIYANAIDTLKSLDNAYDGLDNEVNLGRRRTFVSEEMMSYDSGEQKLTFDPNDISVYRMPKGFNKDSMIEHDNDSLRTGDYIDTVNYQLKMLSSKVGFGQERYKFDGHSIQTATGVISQNSDMFRTVKKHEQLLQSALINMVKAIAYASTAFGKYDIKADAIKIDFDDSIIEDTGAEKTRAMQEVSQGLRSKESYMINYRMLNEKQVEEELEKIQGEKMSNQEAFGFELKEG